MRFLFCSTFTTIQVHKELCYGMDSVNSNYHFEYLVLAKGNPWVKENPEFEQPQTERVDVDLAELLALSAS